MSKFTKKGVRLSLSKEEQEIEDYINNQKYTTSDSIWTGGIYNGFKIQKAADTPNNRIRGDHHKRALDSIFKVLKWNCSKYSKALVFRYDLLPAFADLDIKKFHKDLIAQLGKIKLTKEYNFVAGDKQKGESVYGYPSYIWVREKGKSEVNQGEHFHGALFCKKLQGVSVAQIKDNFREVATNCIRLQLEKAIATAKPNSNRHTILTASLNELTPKANGNKELESPYVKLKGYFILERGMLDKRYASVQKSEINKLLRSGDGHKYIDIGEIIKRKRQRKKAIGGILEECVYALSYLSKVASKTIADFPPETRRFGKSRLQLNPKEMGFHKDIEAKQKVIEEIFKGYQNK